MSKSPLFVGFISLVAVLLLLIFGIAAVGPSLKNQKVNGDELVDQNRPTTPRIDFGNPGLGPTDAPLTIIYYGDFECPSCADYDVTLRQLLTEFPGQLRLVWKDLPNTRLHPEAMNAAIAARCAGEQGAFWEYHDQLMANQASLDASNYLIFARQLELDQESFDTCLQERRPEPLIERDINEAIDLNVTATPYTFIGETRRAGAVSADELKNIIEVKLSAF